MKRFMKNMLDTIGGWLMFGKIGKLNIGFHLCDTCSNIECYRVTKLGRVFMQVERKLSK